jgi:hypothetical protein
VQLVRQVCLCSRAWRVSAASWTAALSCVVAATGGGRAATFQDSWPSRQGSARVLVCCSVGPKELPIWSYCLTACYDPTVQHTALDEPRIISYQSQPAVSSSRFRWIPHTAVLARNLPNTVGLPGRPLPCNAGCSAEQSGPAGHAAVNASGASPLLDTRTLGESYRCCRKPAEQHADCWAWCCIRNRVPAFYEPPELCIRCHCLCAVCTWHCNVG